ncbi:hypothetical protein HUJ05_001721 [Dendroctonus ponderosae]|nr:hypothetical protein HUJ05_001721 [Dendroctonus ponderosae]
MKKSVEYRKRLIVIYSCGVEGVPLLIETAVLVWGNRMPPLTAEDVVGRFEALESRLGATLEELKCSNEKPLGGPSDFRLWFHPPPAVSGQNRPAPYHGAPIAVTFTILPTN